MILLKATTETLQITTSSTADVDYSVSYIDTTATTSLSSSSEAKIASVVTTVLLAAPGASTKRLIKDIVITNVHATALNTITIAKVISGTNYRLISRTKLLAGEMMCYMDRVGWRYYASNGTIKADQSVTRSADTQVQGNDNGVLSAATAASFTQRTGAGLQTWLGVASSSDGTKLVACAQFDYIYTSIDSGVSWTQRTSAGSASWDAVASSSDGTKLVAGMQSGYIYTSIDSGVSWTQRTSAGVRSWYGVACSADGTKLVAAAFGDYIYTSIDSGVSWTQQTSVGMANWAAVASSADGTKLVAAASANYLYTSIDSGVSWTQQTSAGLTQWAAVACSADGTKLVAGDRTSSNGYIYTSPSPTLTWDSASKVLAINGLSPIVRLRAISAEPVTPAAGTVQVYAKAIAGKMQLKIKGPSGLDTPLQAALWQNNTIIWTPQVNVGIWQGTAGATVGTAAIALPTTTNIYTMMRCSTFASAVTTPNQQVGIRTENMFTRGNMNDMGGFLFVCRFGFTSIKTGMRAFVGLCASTTIVSVDPSSTVNICGFGFDLADSAWSFMHNDGLGSATKEVVGGQGTLATNNTGYDAYIWWSPNRSEVYYRLDRTDTGATLVDGSVSTDLPVSTATLMATAQMSNGTANIVANDAVLGINRLYVETDR